MFYYDFYFVYIESRFGPFTFINFVFRNHYDVVYNDSVLAISKQDSFFVKVAGVWRYTPEPILDCIP